MARIGKKPAPKAKAVEKKERAAPRVKDCCGAQRGHKSTCKMLLASEREDNHGIDTDPVDQETISPADVLDEVETEPGVGTTLVAALRGIEESASRMAESIDSIKIIIGSYVNGLRTAQAPVEAPQAAPRAPRKAKAAPEAVQAAPVAQEPAQAPQDTEDAGGADLFPDVEPVAPKAKAAPAPTGPVTPSADEVRSAFLGYASRKGRDAAVALLQTFGAGKLAEVKTEKLSSLLKKIQEG